MKKILVFVLLLPLGLFSCKKENTDSGNGNGLTRIVFRLTDAPAAYDKVYIDVQGAKAIVNDSTIDLKVNAGVYNLLDFTNGKDTVLVDQEIPSGELSQIRLILGDNNSVMIGKGSYGMKTPSAQQSGLKLNVHASFLQGIAYEYIIDFDAARSIVKTGNSKYILKPVLRVFSKAVSGAIEGVVSPAKAKPLIYAISTQLDSVSTSADTISGNYKFRGLAAGTYKLSFLPVDKYRDTIFQNISVKTAVVTKLDTLKFKLK